MSNSFLTTQRLPVYTESFKSQKDNLPFIALCEDCDEGVSSAIAQDSPNIPYNAMGVRKVPALSALPSFNFPPGKGVVLITDDNKVNRKIIARMLKFYNLESMEAANGKEAVELVRTSQNVTGDTNAPYFGLILMDFQMPVMDGYEAMETLRSNGVTLPIVALTANALSREKHRDFEVGAMNSKQSPSSERTCMPSAVASSSHRRLILSTSIRPKATR